MDADSKTENTSPDDLVGTSESMTAASAALTSESSQEESGQDTGEIAEVQAEAAGPSEDLSETAPVPGENPPDSATVTPIPAKPASNLPAWVHEMSRYHNDMNGLLAGKENLKIMAVNTSARPSFYKKWVYEANQFARLTVNLRHRQRRAFARFKDAPIDKKEDPAA